MSDERERREQDVEVKRSEGRYGKFSKDYVPIPAHKAMPIMDPGSPELLKRNYPTHWTKEDWSRFESHYMIQVERITDAWEDDTYNGWEVWMEVTKLIIVMLGEMGLTRLCRTYFFALFDPGEPSMLSFRYNLYMTRVLQEEWEKLQGPDVNYDRTVREWSLSEEEGEGEGEGRVEGRGAESYEETG